MPHQSCVNHATWSMSERRLSCPPSWQRRQFGRRASQTRLSPLQILPNPHGMEARKRCSDCAPQTFNAVVSATAASRQIAKTTQRSGRAPEFHRSKLSLGDETCETIIAGSVRSVTPAMRHCHLCAGPGRVRSMGCVLLRVDAHALHR